MFNLTTKPVSAGELMKKEKKPINFVVDKLYWIAFKINFEVELQRLLKGV